MAMVPHGSGGVSGGRGPEWAARFPVYQIDFTAVASGKRIATTKRRVRWRFGFSNKEALENGETGTACRGEEHDVTIVWSVTSGKRLVLCDGQEVHYSTNRTSVLEYSWTMRGSHVLKVIAHAAPSLTASPGFRQYDFFVNGQSFFNMPKVYELGLRGPLPNQDRVPGVIPQGHQYGAPPGPDGRYYDAARGQYIGAPTTREQEEADLQKAISISIEESKRHLTRSLTSGGDNPAPSPAPLPSVPPAAPMSAPGGGDLLDLSGGPSAPPPAAPMPPGAPVPPSSQALVPSANQPASPYAQPVYPPAPTPYGAPAPAPYGAPPESYAVPPPAVDAYGGYPGQTAPPPTYPASTPYAPAPDSSPVYAGAPPAPIAPETAAPPIYSAPPPPPPVDMYSQPPPPGPASGGMDVFGGPPAAPQDPFAPQAASDPFAPQAPAAPSFNDISNSILGAYGTTAEHPPAVDGGVAPQPHEEAGAVSAPEGPVQLSMGALANDPAEQKEEEPKNEVDKMMKKLVNFNDITSPAEEDKPLTLNPFADDRQKQEDEKKKKLGKSRGIPPPAANWAGPQPTLAEMKAVRPQTGPKEAVMSSPFTADAQYAGALVVHGSQPGGYGQGPPPIARAQGFGLGAALPGGGYGQPGGQPQQAMGGTMPPNQFATPHAPPQPYPPQQTSYY